MNEKLSRFKLIDWWLIIPTTFLVILGLVVQYAILFKTKGVDIDFDLNAQIVAIFLSLVTVMVTTYLSPKNVRKILTMVYAAMIVALILVLVIGRGEDVSRWLNIGSLQLQPTEIAKLGLAGLLASMFTVGFKRQNRYTFVFWSLLVAGIPLILTAMQPDLGSALVFIFIWLGAVLASKVRLSKILVVGLVLLTLVISAVPLLAQYQQERLISYFNPTVDTQGVNYNTVQAGIAIGSGGIFGNGLDSGSQSQLNFLPSQHTDFAFAVTAEKLGLLGAGAVILAFTVLFLRLTYHAWRTKSAYNRVFIAAITSFLLFHVAVNIGMNIGLLPVTGLPLPFISYGGTSMFVSLISVLLVNVMVAKEHTSLL